MPNNRDDVNHPAIRISTATNSDATFECFRPRDLGFASIPNDTINDKRLISGTLDMLMYLWAKPNATKIPTLDEKKHWKLRVQNLMDRFTIGRDKVYRLLNVLQEAGYVKAVYLKKPDGTPQNPGIKYLYDIYPTFLEENTAKFNKKKENKANKAQKTLEDIGENQFPDYQEPGFQEPGNQDAYKIKNTSTKEIFSTNKTDPTREIAKNSKLGKCLEKEQEEKAEVAGKEEGASTTFEAASPPNSTRAQPGRDNPNPLSSYRRSADRVTTMPTEAKSEAETTKLTPPTSPEGKSVVFRDIPADIVFTAPIRVQLAAAGIKPNVINYWIKEFGEELLNSFWSEMKERAREIQITSVGGYLHTLVMAERNIRNGKTAENVVCADVAMFVDALADNGQAVDSV